MVGKVDMTILGPLVSFILGGGLIGGYATFRKLKPESDRLVVDSAQIVLTMSNAQLKRTQDEITELREEIRQMRELQTKQSRESAVALAECNAERRELRKERDDERANNWELRSRIEVLEAEVAQLRALGTNPKETQ